MSRDRAIGRRDFLLGAFRGRNRAVAFTGMGAWTHALDESRGAEDTPRPPDWERDMDHVLKEMHDLKGIEDP